MHDLKALRADPAAFDAALARRGVANASAAILEADAALRSVQTALQGALARRNEASKAIGAAKANKDDATAEALMAEVTALKAEIAEAEAEERERAAQVEALAAALPNLPAPDVPDGADEHGNVERKRWGTPRNGGAEHDALAEKLGWNPEGAARLSGSRFMVLEGQLARLHRALGQFMLDRQVAAGWRETVVPLLVRDEAVFGTGQLPKFAEDLFRTTDGRWLIPTAEVSLTNLVNGQILDSEELPLRLTALTPCFRSEAGAAGKDTRGLIRQHQFEKVELVTICAPEQSEAEHERMLLAAEAVLEALELPYRRMLLCAGDMGFSATRTYDLEVWLPGAGAYREISSVSNCGAFQARRMEARFKTRGEKGTTHLHTLNGSGLAVGRTLVAVLENHQLPDGGVRLPDALRPYMGGLETLTPEP
ncbi:serine--tRNA ligase [Sandaracinobacter sp. RS1-74]|uniref:serine--tRNA ligase n=1 Tax=Sandaracinobacteroides sayramensis TaxID=2913411 RepID=UPI001EDB88EF|nr:serine--tRNA ligase [Sandaracinobacteroides sayramensis]MCG2840701.1 serine--tRNA ligase [Sandaracinobacteroides sayramensis]